MARLFPVVIKKTTTVSGGGPTFTIKDYVGASDNVALPFALRDSAGAGDTAVAMGLNPTDNIGASDALALTGVPKFSDYAGARDSIVLGAAEAAQARSGSPDNDSWGDAWVDRLLANQSVNHGADAGLTVSASTAATETDGYMKIDFRRFTSLVAGAGTCTLTFKALWTNNAVPSTGILLMDLRSAASSPWTESTITASNRARFTSSSPYSQRTFGDASGGTAAFDGTLRTWTVTFTTAEVNDFLGKWLELQFTVADLVTLNPIVVQSREATTTADRPSYSFSLAKG